MESVLLRVSFNSLSLVMSRITSTTPMMSPEASRNGVKLMQALIASPSLPRTSTSNRSAAFPVSRTSAKGQPESQIDSRTTSRQCFPTMSSRRCPERSWNDRLAYRILPSGEMATIPSVTDSTSSESNDPGVFIASSVHVKSIVSLYTVYCRMFQGLNGRYGMKHAALSVQPFEM